MSDTVDARASDTNESRAQWILRVFGVRVAPHSQAIAADAASPPSAAAPQRGATPSPPATAAAPKPPGAPDRENDKQAYDRTAATMMPLIRRAGAYIAQSGAMKGQEKAKDEIASIAKKAADAAKKSDYETANVLLTEAGSRARAVNVPYDTLIEAEQCKPLFARAEKLLERKMFSASGRKYKQAAKDHAAALKTTDYGKWNSTFLKKKDLAKQIVKKGQEAAVVDWFKSEQARPASGTSLTRPRATGLSTMPDLGAMSEAQKLEAMKKGLGRPDLMKAVIDKYAEALSEGQKLDLTPAQIAAAMGYSGLNYGHMNGLLRGSLDTTRLDPEQLDLIKVQIDLLCEALERLPDYDPGGFPLFRWETPYGDFLESRYQVSSEFTIKEFWSTGAGGGSAVVAGSRPTAEILIWGKKKSKAKAIDMLSEFGGGEGSRSDGSQLKGQGAGEVLFPPGTKFKTQARHTFNRANKEVLVRADSMDPKMVVDFHYRIEVVEV